MTKLRGLLVATAITAVAVLAGAAPAWASSARCTSGYNQVVVYGAHPDLAINNAARAVWTARYGNIGGWIISSKSQSSAGTHVYGYRPGTSLNVYALCQLL